FLWYPQAVPWLVLASTNRSVENITNVVISQAQEASASRPQARSTGTDWILEEGGETGRRQETPEVGLAERHGLTLKRDRLRPIAQRVPREIILRHIRRTPARIGSPFRKLQLHRIEEPKGSL